MIIQTGRGQGGLPELRFAAVAEAGPQAGHPHEHAGHGNGQGPVMVPLPRGPPPVPRYVRKEEGMATVELTAENFETVIGDADLALVDFWASWCGPCRTFGPIFERVSDQHEDAVFGKVDTEAQQALAASFGITSIPTLMIIRDKVILYAQPGAIPEPALEDLIAKARAVDMDEVRASIAGDKAGAT